MLHTRPFDEEINSAKSVWRQNIYHKPQDDMSQAFDFESGAKYSRYAFFVGYLVAQQNEKPTWNRGDFFGEHYGKNKMN